METTKKHTKTFIEIPSNRSVFSFPLQSGKTCGSHLSRAESWSRLERLGEINSIHGKIPRAEIQNHDDPKSPVSESLEGWWPTGKKHVMPFHTFSRHFMSFLLSSLSIRRHCWNETLTCRYLVCWLLWSSYTAASRPVALLPRWFEPSGSNQQWSNASQPLPDVPFRSHVWQDSIQLGGGWVSNFEPPTPASQHSLSCPYAHCVLQDMSLLSVLVAMKQLHRSIKTRSTFASMVWAFRV